MRNLILMLLGAGNSILDQFLLGWPAGGGELQFMGVDYIQYCICIYIYIYIFVISYIENIIYIYICMKKNNIYIYMKIAALPPSQKSKAPPWGGNRGFPLGSQYKIMCHLQIYLSSSFFRALHVCGMGFLRSSFMFLCSSFFRALPACES